MAHALTLDPVLDLNAAAPLQGALLALRGEALRIDAAAVQRLGGLCLQVLLSAQRTWAEDAVALSIAPRSPSFEEALRTFGAESRFEPSLLDELEAK